ncbi:ABC transporter ATP-binding protein [Candidatus Sumerlaeota bacterium]|nr:ABC transporter ATP-binding protein [Candidatus Sumerlaeota bacterium]
MSKEQADRKVLISVRDAARIFNLGEVTVPALRNASIDIFEGEFLVVLGPSGSGKSTLLNLVGGMDRASSGHVFFRDEDLTEKTDNQLTLYRRNQVGFVFQFYNLVPTLTALENIQVATDIVPDPLDAMECLAMVGLEKRSHHFPSQMSGGEQQRVAIARAIAGNPALLLCDEPTGALDMKTGKDVIALLLRLNEKIGKTVAMITHNPGFSEIGHRIATLKDGQIVSIVENAMRKSVEEIDW